MRDQQMQPLDEAFAARVEAPDAADPVEQPLLELAANLLRVVGGAGNPKLLGSQAAVLADRLPSHQGSVVVTAAKAFARAQAPVFDASARCEYGDSETAWRRARWLIMHGTLQVLASEMLGQRTQAKIGTKQINAGLRALARLRDRQRESLYSGHAANESAMSADQRMP